MRFFVTLCFVCLLASFFYGMRLVTPFPGLPSGLGWLGVVLFVILLVGCIFQRALKAQDEAHLKRERDIALRAGCQL